MGVECRDSVGLGRRREVAEKLLWLRTVKKAGRHTAEGHDITEQGAPSCRRDWKGSLTEASHGRFDEKGTQDSQRRDSVLRLEKPMVTDVVDRKAVCSFAVRAGR